MMTNNSATGRTLLSPSPQVQGAFTCLDQPPLIRSPLQLPALVALVGNDFGHRIHAFIPENGHLPTD